LCEFAMESVRAGRELAVGMQGKSRLGQVVDKKTASCCALTAIQNEDQRELAQLVETCKSNYNNVKRISWGGGIMGPKSQHSTLKRNRALQREAEKRMAVA
jgi:large subunit ribosomal protein L7Ae